MEADLSSVHTLRYSDRWRFDEYGRRCLTLREIWVRLQYLPDDAALVILANEGRRWGTGDHLLADVFQAITRQPHPLRPKSSAQKAAERAEAEALQQAKDKAREKFAARNRAIERGEIL